MERTISWDLYEDLYKHYRRVQKFTNNIFSNGNKRNIFSFLFSFMLKCLYSIQIVKCIHFVKSFMYTSISNNRQQLTSSPCSILQYSTKNKQWTTCLQNSVKIKTHTPKHPKTGEKTSTFDFHFSFILAIYTLKSR